MRRPALANSQDHDWERQTQKARLDSWYAVRHQPVKQGPVRQQLKVCPAPRVGSQSLVEPSRERLDGPSCVGVARIKPIAAATSICMSEDLGRINEALCAPHQYGNASAALALGRHAVQQGHVRLLAIRDQEAVQRPSRLLCVVAVRHGDHYRRSVDVGHVRGAGGWGCRLECARCTGHGHESEGCDRARQLAALQIAMMAAVRKGRFLDGGTGFFSSA